MPALDAVAAAGALSNGNVETPARAAARPADLLDIASRGASASGVRRNPDKPTAAGPRRCHRCGWARPDGPDARTATPAFRPGRRGGRGGVPAKTARLGDAAPAALVELVFEPVDIPLQLVALLAIPIPVLVRALLLAAQPLDLALLSFELVNQRVRATPCAIPCAHVRPYAAIRTGE